MSLPTDWFYPLPPGAILFGPPDPLPLVKLVPRDDAAMQALLDAMERDKDAPAIIVWDSIHGADA